MHVRIAWEIYHHQAKQNPDKTNPVKTEMLRSPSHMYPPPPGASLARPPDMPGSHYGAGMPPGRSPFDPSPLPPTFMNNPASHLGEFLERKIFFYFFLILTFPFELILTAASGVSPFGRYASPFGASHFASMSPFARDIPIGTSLVHDPWRG
jgi:autism susceptibility gene 2 protein